MPFLDYVDLKNVYCHLYTEYIHLQTYKFSVLLWFLQALQPAQGFLETKWKGFFCLLLYIVLILSLGVEVGSHVAWAPIFDKLPFLPCSRPQHLFFLSLTPSLRLLSGLQ